MSTTVSLPSRSSLSSRRTQLLASASALVAAASVAVTLAVAGGGNGEPSAAQPSGGAGTAQPQPATQYRNESATPQAGTPAGGSAAERFHHFR